MAAGRLTAASSTSPSGQARPLPSSARPRSALRQCRSSTLMLRLTCQTSSPFAGIKRNAADLSLVNGLPLPVVAHLLGQSDGPGRDNGEGGARVGSLVWTRG